MSVFEERAEVVRRAFRHLFRCGGVPFGNNARGVLGVSDGAEGVQWNARYRRKEATFGLGVNLEGKAYDDWPVARLIERELAHPRLLTEYRDMVPRPDLVRVNWKRDAWQVASRVKIEEPNLLPTPIATGSAGSGRLGACPEWRARVSEPRTELSRASANHGHATGFRQKGRAVGDASSPVLVTPPEGWPRPRKRSVPRGIMRMGLPSALALTLFVLPGRGRAQDGWYMGMQLGTAAAQGIDVKTGGLDDWSSSDVSSVRCDVTLNPDRVQVEPGACSDVPLPWGPLEESFDGGAGTLAGMVLGYRRRSLRFEGEYVYRSTAHDATAVPHNPVTNYDPTRDASFDMVRDAVDDVMSHSAFANLYYHFRSRSKVAPYLGMGVGFSDVSVEYRTLWHRTKTLKNILIFDPAGERGEEMNRRLLGTNTIDRARLSESLIGYQAVAGLDYQVGGRITLGFKLRWVGFGEFEDESEYDSLRGHASVAGNPPVPVTYYVRTEDLGFLAFSLDMKSRF